MRDSGPTIAASASNAEIALFDQPVYLLNERLVAVLVFFAEHTHRHEWRDEWPIGDRIVQYRLQVVCRERGHRLWKYPISCVT